MVVVRSAGSGVKLSCLSSWFLISSQVKIGQSLFAARAVCTQSRLKEEIQFCVVVMKCAISYTVSVSVGWTLVEFHDTSLERKRKGRGGVVRAEDALGGTEKEGVVLWEPFLDTNPRVLQCFAVYKVHFFLSVLTTTSIL